VRLSSIGRDFIWQGHREIAASGPPLPRSRAAHRAHNSPTHSTPTVQPCLDQHTEVQFHFTPKGASWLNMVEA
jgi:hypothetical protein